MFEFLGEMTFYRSDEFFAPDNPPYRSTLVAAMGKTLGKADSTPKGIDLKNRPSSNVIDNRGKKGWKKFRKRS